MLSSPTKFAVVADQVRKLAERTSGATKQISEMIRVIQGKMQKAVSAMKVGTTEVEEGIRLSDSTGEALNQILAEAQDMMQKGDQMASINEEQFDSQGVDLAR